MTTMPTSVYTFGAAGGTADGSILYEIDGAMHLDADGNERSSFLPDEPVHFLLHYDKAKRRIRSLKATDGGDVQYIGPVTRTRTEQLTFQHPAHLLDLRYQPAGTPAAEWYGRGSNLYPDGRQLQADMAPCLGDLTYSVRFEQYLHKPAPATIEDGKDFPTDVIIEYEEVK